MVVQRPEVLDRAEGDDRPLVLLPTFVSVVLEEPERPVVLEKEAFQISSTLTPH